MSRPRLAPLCIGTQVLYISHLWDWHGRSLYMQSSSDSPMTRPDHLEQCPNCCCKLSKAFIDSRYLRMSCVVLLGRESMSVLVGVHQSSSRLLCLLAIRRWNPIDPEKDWPEMSKRPIHPRQTTCTFTAYLPSPPCFLPAPLIITIFTLI